MAKQLSITRMESFLLGSGITFIVGFCHYKNKSDQNQERIHKYKINNRKQKEQNRKLELELKQEIKLKQEIEQKRKLEINKTDLDCKKSTGWFSWSCSKLEQEPHFTTNAVPVPVPVKPKKIIKTIDFNTMHKDVLDEIDFDAVTEIRNCNNIQILKRFENVKILHLTCEYETKDIPDSVTDIVLKNDALKKFLGNSEKYKLPDQIETIRAPSVNHEYFLNRVDELYLPKSLKMIYNKHNPNRSTSCCKGDTMYNEHVKNANINSVK